MNLSYSKKRIKTALFSLVLASGVAFILGSSDLKRPNESTKTQESVENYEAKEDDFSLKKEEKIAQDQVIGDFIIKEYNGSVAVFENGKTLPFKTTETMVDDLPATDRELLKKGIIVGSKEELSRVLEDYCS